MLNVWQLSSGHSIFTWARMWESIRGHFAKPKAVRGAKQFGGRCCVRWVVRSLLWQCLKLVQRTAVQCNVTPGCVQGKQVWATSSLVPWCQLASSTPIHTDTTPNTIRSIIIIYVRRVNGRSSHYHQVEDTGTWRKIVLQHRPSKPDKTH